MSSIKLLHILKPFNEKDKNLAEDVKRIILQTKELSFVEDPTKADIILVLGGDGTLLEAMASHIDSAAAFLGINTGRLGFLTCVQFDEIQLIGPTLVSENYVVREFSSLQSSNSIDTDTILNEIALVSTLPGRAVRLNVAVDSEPIVTFTGDGLIVATPMGSTAYNLSAGGPVLGAGLDAFIVTPLAPHNLFRTPLVFANNTIIEVTALDNRDCTIVVDGKPVGVLANNETLRITGGTYRGKIIRFHNWGEHFRKRFSTTGTSEDLRQIG